MGSRVWLSRDQVLGDDGFNGLAGQAAEKGSSDKEVIYFTFQAPPYDATGPKGTTDFVASDGPAETGRPAGPGARA